ncbi:hypothetical protein MTO96_020515 [Rhipicephalus appendiculatus]
MDVTCLVHRGPSSYVLTVAGGHKMEDLKAAMAAHSSLHSVQRRVTLPAGTLGIFMRPLHGSLSSDIRNLKMVLLLNEFYRLTGVNAKEALLTLVRKHGQQILALAPSSSRPDVEDPDNPYHCTVAVLMSVPRLVKEDPTAIITQLVPGESHVYPKLLHSADHPATSSALLVAFETLQLNALDIVDGVALVLAVFWAFNIQYTPKAKRTCLLLEALMGLQPTAFAPSVVKVATAIMRGGQQCTIGLQGGQPPQPYSFGYNNVDEYGNRQFHSEQGDSNNAKTGSYGYRDANGIFRRVNYVADAYGFRATVDTNEPGTAPGASADAVFNSASVVSPVQSAAGQSPGTCRLRWNRQLRRTTLAATVVTVDTDTTPTQALLESMGMPLMGVTGGIATGPALGGFANGGQYPSDYAAAGYGAGYGPDVYGGPVGYGRWPTAPQEFRRR